MQQQSFLFHTQIRFLKEIACLPKTHRGKECIAAIETQKLKENTYKKA